MCIQVKREVIRLLHLNAQPLTVWVLKDPVAHHLGYAPEVVLLKPGPWPTIVTDRNVYLLCHFRFVYEYEVVGVADPARLIRVYGVLRSVIKEKSFQRTLIRDYVKYADELRAKLQTRVESMP